MVESIIPKMRITYCDSWFGAKKCYTTIWAEEHARQAHSKGDLYTVLIGDPQKPDCFVEVNLKVKFIGVTFLDGCLREYLDYSFVEKQPGMLFLDRAIFREYDGDSDLVVKSQIFRYKPNGLTSLEEADLLINEAITTEKLVDVSKNWELVPGFGDYASISRLER